jgi:cytochrome c
LYGAIREPAGWSAQVLRYATIGFAAALLAGGAQAQQGDPDAGATLVHEWCTDCHVVDDRGTGSDVGPPLPLLLENELRTSDEIRGWLANPHPPMPDFDLTRQEIDDVVAYLERLRRLPTK